MSASETRKWMGATFILVVAVASPFTPVTTAPRVARATANAASTAADLRAQVQRLVEQGELGEAMDLANVAASLAPDDPASWQLVTRLQSSVGR